MGYDTVEDNITLSTRLCALFDISRLNVSRDKNVLAIVI